MFFGAHVSSSGGIDKAIDRALAINADAVQIFVQSPRTWRPAAHKQEKIDRFRELRESKLQGAVAHAIYLINIASDNPELWDKSVTALAHTMVIGAELGLDAVIFHPGSHKGAESGLAGCVDRVAKGCLLAIEAGAKAAEAAGRSDGGPSLLLENSAGQGGTIGRDIEELIELIQRADSHEKLGVCIDSCHWWVSGIDVRDTKSVMQQIELLDSAIGADRLQALHLNDAKTALGSNSDRHDNLGEGQIGAELKSFIQLPRFAHLGAYLEVPGEGDGPRAEDIETARTMLAST